MRCVYGDDTTVDKYECVGHYQKRVGTRLLNLKKRTPGLKELTKPIINKLQNYFGIALRSNLTTVVDMGKAIFASFLHVQRKITGMTSVTPLGASTKEIEKTKKISTNPVKDFH